MSFYQISAIQLAKTLEALGPAKKKPIAKNLNENLKENLYTLVDSIQGCQDQLDAGCQAILFPLIEGTGFNPYDHLQQFKKADLKKILFLGERSIPFPEAQQIQVSDIRYVRACLYAEIFGHPQNDLIIVGITGTNGKTSVTWMLREMFTTRGSLAASIGTLGFYLGNEKLEAGALTSPDPKDLFALLQMAKNKKARLCFLELSSIALEQKRFGPLACDIVGMTNFTQDHLDYHQTMAAYLEAKRLAFTEFAKKEAPFFLMKSLAGILDKPVWATIRQRAHWVPDSNEMSFQEKNLALAKSIADSIASTYGLSFDVDQAHSTVPGRMEKVHSHIYIDYAHTPDALQNVLMEAKETLAPRPLLVVFGCGGNRDKKKRAPMAAAAEKHADQVVLTSDNPRSEHPEAILEDIKKGFSADFLNTKVEVEVDRKKAIFRALALHQSHAILICGKGHEQTMEINGVKLPFDEKEIIEEYFFAKGSKHD